MEREYIYTIQPHDVGRNKLPLDREDFDRQIYIGDWLGQVQPQHIGRRIYIHNSCYSLETKTEYIQRTGGQF